MTRERVVDSAFLTTHYLMMIVNDDKRRLPASKSKTAKSQVSAGWLTALSDFVTKIHAAGTKNTT